MGLHIRMMTIAMGLALLLTLSASAQTRTAALLNTDLPAANDPSLAKALASALQQVGYKVIEIGADGLRSAAVLDPAKIDLLVLPNSASLPAASADTIDKYLRGGGDIIALDAPMWQESLINMGGRWITSDQYQVETAGTAPDHALFKFASENLKAWTRSSNKLENPAAYESIPDGPIPGFGALHVVVSNHQGWDTFGSPTLSSPFRDGDSLTVITAKGDKATRQMSVEWEEKDGSRWIAVIHLSDAWRQYVLKPDDFHYWTSNPARGAAGDKFNPQNAVHMAVGIAFSHTGFIAGRQEYWVGSVGTTKMTPDLQELLSASNPPVLDTLSPGYKFFDSSQVSKLAVRNDQVITGAATLETAETRSSSPRPKGGGFDKGRAWRWIPLVDASTAGGEWRGVPATLIVNTDGPYKGGIWASFGVKGSEWYKSAAVQKLIGDVAARMKNGVFILDGGSNFYTYFSDQSMTLGIKTANIGGTDSPSLTGRVTVTDTSTGRPAAVKEWKINAKSGATVSTSSKWKPSAWPAKGFTVTAELLDAGRVIDRVSHEAFVWTPKKQKDFITIKDGDFMLNGKRWRANGVNYMPSSGIATEDSEYFENWIGPRAYDPEVIERDIRHMKDTGLNSVSIFAYHSSIKAQNLLDLLRRLDSHGMKANLSMRPGTPMEFLWPQMKEIIQRYRLKDNDTVFAYDLAWEPWHGNHDARKPWDGEWEKWIIERYGSIANAERDWKYPVPRDEAGKITNPSPQHFTDGKWHTMAAAYRRFLDTLLYRKYDAARRLVKSIDPNHHVGFRMSDAGNPTFYSGESLPYDFPYVATAVDILEPEAYGRIGEWENVKPGIFEYEYARWAAPQKPMFWAEAGYSAWDVSVMKSSSAGLDFQGNLIGNLYKMMTSSGADGVFFWWYPGGFRYGENSDYGIINPDGSDRPSTQAIRENGPKFIAGPSAKPVDVWLEMDRDRYPVGIGGVYDSLKDKFWTAIDNGQTPGLRTAGTGTDSSNCPLTAVGDTEYNGSNPPKYLDGAFDVVEVRNADGKWIPTAKGGSVRVSASKPVLARVTLTNLGEAAWSSSQAKEVGGVRLTVNGVKIPQALKASIPHQGSATISNVTLAPAGLKGESKATLGLEADGRARFGEKFGLTLIAE